MNIKILDTAHKYIVHRRDVILDNTIIHLYCIILLCLIDIYVDDFDYHSKIAEEIGV